MYNVIEAVIWLVILLLTIYNIRSEIRRDELNKLIRKPTDIDRIDK